MQPESGEKRLTITRDQLVRLRAHVGRSICRVIGCIDDETGEMLGSGTVVDVRGTTYLLTANHVVRQQFDLHPSGERRYTGLAHDTGLNGPVFRIVNPVHGYGGLRDVAVVRLINEDFASTPVIPVSLLSIPKRCPDLQDEILFVLGFPGKKSRYVRAWKGIVSESFPWVATEEPSACSWFDRCMHVAIGYPAKGLDETGREVDMPDPQGLSGSGLWKTNVSARGKLWTPEDAEMVGVVTDWDQGSQTLIATRIEFFWTLLLHTVQRESAYFRWLARDKQHGDDWADWFAAEKDIQDLL
jgi:hypothetical protein